MYRIWEKIISKQEGHKFKKKQIKWNKMQDIIAQICSNKINMKNFKFLYLQGNLKLIRMFNHSNNHLDNMVTDIL